MPSTRTPQKMTTTSSPNPDTRAPSRALLAGVTVFVLLFGLLGYAWRGNRDGLSNGPGEAAPSAASSASAAEAQARIDAMVNRLAERLKTNPDDAQGWAMLARAYSVQGRAEEALPAYKRVVDLRPNDAQALADYADGMAAIQRTLDGEPEKLVKQALKLDPANVKALSLAGAIAFGRDDFNGAASYWQRALDATEPDGELAVRLKGALTQAREQAGQAASAAPGAVAATSPPPAGSGAASTGVITGRVSIAAALQGQVGPDDTVFIFARPAAGSKMPLAILRKRAGDLPLAFTLDDSLAMSPAARLSSAQQVVVGARISKSGNAMPQPGDLQVLSAVVPVGQRDLRLEIAETLR